MVERGMRSVYTARGQVEGEDWPAVAAALNERMAARRVGQQELARLSGVSVSTLRMLQHGARRRVQNKTLEAICRALEWPEDHLIGVLLTAPVKAAPSSPTDAPLIEALQRIERQLEQISNRLDRVERRSSAAEEHPE